MNRRTAWIAPMREATLSFSVEAAGVSRLSLLAAHAGTQARITVIDQRGEKLVIRADVPGLERGDVDVSIEDHELTIKGERRAEHEEERAGTFVSERSYGRFCRSITLPDNVNTDTASASFNNGVLEIELQYPAQRARGRTIEIKQAEEPKQGEEAKQAEGQTEQQPGQPSQPGT